MSFSNSGWRWKSKLTLAATKLLTNRDIDDLTAIDAALHEAASRKEDESLRRGYNHRFHFRLYECADLPQTLHFVRVVWAKYPFDLLGALPNRAEQVASEHDAIMQGLRIRDPRATMRAMQLHLEAGHRLFKANYAVRAAPDPRPR